MSNQRIQVFVRSRPADEKEIQIIECSSVKKSVIVNDRRAVGVNRTKTYHMDGVFGPYSEQCDVYSCVLKPRLRETIEGYNCTVFAYGQTGTGKTFTMLGERSDVQTYQWGEDPKAGLVPRALVDIFSLLQASGKEFAIRISFLEIYNEVLKDLLYDGVDPPKLQVYDCQEQKGNVKVKGLSEVAVKSSEEAWALLEKGVHVRQTFATNVNLHSSRSHSVFTIQTTIREQLVDGNNRMVFGKLHLVDLAGSECIGRSGATDMRAREAGKINTSLLTLNRVISALVNKGSHVPFRESKLTRLLQDSLGGRTKTSIIATISPSRDCMEETISTLDYANTARDVTNRPEINMKVHSQGVLNDYEYEIAKLRDDLAATREKNGIYVKEERYVEMLNRIELLESQVMSQKMCIEQMVIEKNHYKQVIHNEKIISRAHQRNEMEIFDKANSIYEILNDTVDKINSLRQGLDASVQRDLHHRKTICSCCQEEIDRLHTVMTCVEDVSQINNETKHQVPEFIANDGVRITKLLNDWSEQLQELWSRLECNFTSLPADHQLILESTQDIVKEIKSCLHQHVEECESLMGKHEDVVKHFQKTLQCDLKSITQELNDFLHTLTAEVSKMKENLMEFAESVKSTVKQKDVDFRQNEEKLLALSSSLNNSTWFDNIRKEQDELRETMNQTVQEAMKKLADALEKEKELSEKLDNANRNWVQKHSEGIKCGLQASSVIHNELMNFTCSSVKSHEEKETELADKLLQISTSGFDNMNCLCHQMEQHLTEQDNVQLELPKKQLGCLHKVCEQCNVLYDKGEKHFIQLSHLVETTHASVNEMVTNAKLQSSNEMNDICGEISQAQRMAVNYVLTASEKMSETHGKLKEAVTAACDYATQMESQCNPETTLAVELTELGYDPPNSESRNYLSEVTPPQKHTETREEIIAKYNEEKSLKRKHDLDALSSDADSSPDQVENCVPDNKKVKLP